jgi:hypothetical protein
MLKPRNRVGERSDFVTSRDARLKNPLTGKRPRARCAAEKRDELAPFQLIELHSVLPARTEIQDIASGAPQKDAHWLDGRCGLGICARLWLVVEERISLYRLWLDEVLRSGGCLFARLFCLPESTRGQSQELYFPHRLELEV